MRAAAVLALGAILAIGVACSSRGDGSLAPSPTPPPIRTPLPISEDNAIWEWIAANSPEVEPVLRPTYLPSNLDHVSLDLAGQQRGCVLFNVTYTDSAGKARLSVGGGPWYNLPIPGPDALQGEVEVRRTAGGYQLQHSAEPLGLAFLTWHEPGRWGKPGDNWHRDYVEYLISSEGFGEEELAKVANALQPVLP
jgi:hypothetical protein